MFATPAASISVRELFAFGDTIWSSRNSMRRLRTGASSISAKWKISAWASCRGSTDGGYDAGGTFGLYPGFSLHDELELLVKEVGLTPLEALRSATLNPPAFFDDQGESGAIEPGKLADLVLLDANPLEDIRHTHRIRAVITGDKVFQRANLDHILAGVASAVKTKTGCAVEK
jgi:hypothetical protein